MDTVETVRTRTRTLTRLNETHSSGLVFSTPGASTTLTSCCA
jgi:hypothetical protein